MMSAQELASALDAKKTSKGWQAKCPAHDDKNPSLSISEGQNGKILFYCHAGCGQEGVISALQDMGLWGAPDKEPVSFVKNKTNKTDNLKFVSVVPKGAPIPDFGSYVTGWELVSTWSYETMEGDLIGYICRFVDPHGNKSFRPVTLWKREDSTLVWQLKAFPKPRPLFRQTELHTKSESIVLVVEGEKAAISAAMLFPDYAVITWPGGAKAADLADWSLLSNRRVVIWPDADEPGLKAAEEIAAKLIKCRASSVAVVRLPKNLPKGWDLADPIPNEVDPPKLLADARPFDDTLAGFIRSAADLSALNIPRREYLVDAWLPINSLMMIFAARGVGKTWVALALALAVARGEPFLEYIVTRSAKVLFWDGEMVLADIVERLKILGGHEEENLLVMASELLFRESRSVNINKLEDQEIILRTLERLDEQGKRPDLIIFDNLSSLGGGIDENDNSALEEQLKWLLSLRHTGYAIVLIHHAGKSGDQRGASRREDLLDTSIKLSLPKEDDDEMMDRQGAVFDLEFVKTRGPVPEPTKLRVTLRPNEYGELALQHETSVSIPAYAKTLRAIYEGMNPTVAVSSRIPFSTQKDLTVVLRVSKAKVSKDFSILTSKGLVEIREIKYKQAILVTGEGVQWLRRIFHNLDPVSDRSTVVSPTQLPLDDII